MLTCHHIMLFATSSSTLLLVVLVVEVEVVYRTEFKKETQKQRL